MARAAGAAVATLAAPVVAVPVAKRGRKLAHRAGDVVNKGQEMAGQASEVMDTASNVKDAVSSHSSTIGKVGGVIRSGREVGRRGRRPNEPPRHRPTGHETSLPPTGRRLALSPFFTIP